MGVPELNFIFSFIFISFILPCFVLKAIQSCLQHTYKIRLSLRKCKQVRNKHKEDKLQPAGWPVCGMNSVKLYIVETDHTFTPEFSSHQHREGHMVGGMTSTSFGGQWSIPKKIKQNDYLRKQERKFSHVLCSAGHCGRRQMVGRSLSSSVTQQVTSRGSRKPLSYLRAQCQGKPTAALHGGSLLL